MKVSETKVPPNTPDSAATKADKIAQTRSARQLARAGKGSPEEGAWPMLRKPHVVEFFVRSSLAGFVLAISVGAGAQSYAPGEAVVVPGGEIADWGRVEKIDAHFGTPSANTTKVPAVLILHGSGGIDGRGAYYAKALQDAGIATLEITMFAPGRRPQSGTKATMPFAAAALKWLAAQTR